MKLRTKYKRAKEMLEAVRRIHATTEVPLPRDEYEVTVAKQSIMLPESMLNRIEYEHIVKTDIAKDIGLFLMKEEAIEYTKTRRMGDQIVVTGRLKVLRRKKS